jgi:microfibrillar-associated protein 1
VIASRQTGVGRFGDESTTSKAKWGFMQKYYHKGVFYMDDDSLKAEGDVRKNNFNEPTLEDKFDKEKLPSVLQVKNFGKRGRTKYTHLADQDTTKYNERLEQDDRLRKSYLDKRSGVGSLDNAGRLHKKPKDDV